jgi:enoyl-CoA hydratase/carnithine racemase
MRAERSRNNVVWITLSNPPLNSFTENEIDQLVETVQDIAQDSSVRAVVVTGDGNAFSVGLDLGLLGKGFENPEYFATQLQRFGSALSLLESLEVPTIAAVNGVARAGGFELLLCCDLVIAANEAKIGDTHLVSGLPPGGGATARLPRRVGHQVALELLFTGRWLSGAEAASTGLVLRAVPRADLGDTVASLVDNLASLSRPALAATKRVLRESSGASLQDALEIEMKHFMEFVSSEASASEGYRAFVENRAPVWP